MFARNVRPSVSPPLTRCVPPACLPQSIAYLPHPREYHNARVSTGNSRSRPPPHGGCSARNQQCAGVLPHPLHPLLPLSSLSYRLHTSTDCRPNHLIAKISNHSFPLETTICARPRELSELHTQGVRPLARADQVPAPPPQDQVHPSAQAVRGLLRYGQRRRRVPAFHHAP